MKIPNHYWIRKGGRSDLGFQDNEVIALRAMGYKGTLSDMRWAFYKAKTGVSGTLDARKVYNPTPTPKDYFGKVNGDTDNTRLMYYASPLTVENTPAQMTVQPFASYTNAGSLNDVSAGTETNYVLGGQYAKAQLTFKFTYANYRDIVTMDFKIHASNSVALKNRMVLKVWNTKTNRWENDVFIVASEVKTITFAGKNINDYFDANGTINFTLVSEFTTNGITKVGVFFDYLQFIPKFL